ncbi:MAG: DUF1385 domain-containing protein [Acetatifactor sp.]
MMKRKRKCYSGIGGQAVLEGIMMKNEEKYAVAVRKPNGEIAVELENHQGLLHGSKIKDFPFIRGVVNFIDSFALGMKCLNYSASFYDEEEGAEQKVSESEKEAGQETKKTSQKAGNGAGEKLITSLVTLLSIALAVGIFIVLPYYLSYLFQESLQNTSLLAIIEGAIRIAIFIVYVCAISLMKDIRRLYQYHGAEHKCINCIEKGRPLTVHNVMRSSRLHKRCGTSFIFFVMIVSIVLFFFIQVQNPLYRVFLRILLLPVVAGISYEIIRLAGRSDNILVRIISAPGMLIQRMTTKEPDKEMAEVAIAAVEAVFDWKKFLLDNYGYNVDETWMEEETEE